MKAAKPQEPSSIPRSDVVKGKPQVLAVPPPQCVCTRWCVVGFFKWVWLTLSCKCTQISAHRRTIKKLFRVFVKHSISKKENQVYQARVIQNFGTNSRSRDSEVATKASVCLSEARFPCVCTAPAALGLPSAGNTSIWYHAKLKLLRWPRQPYTRRWATAHGFPTEMGAGNRHQGTVRACPESLKCHSRCQGERPH